MKKPTDANDLHVLRGLPAVTACIDSAAKPGHGECGAADAVLLPDQHGHLPPRAFALTEMGAGEMYVDRFRDEVIFVSGMGWFTWSKSHWRHDPENIAVLKRTKVIAQEFYEEAKWASRADDSREKQFSHFAGMAQKMSFRRSVLDSAKNEQKLDHEAIELDRDPMLLNVRNGTINLRTGELHRHKPSDYITRVIPIDYDPAAKCQRFERFLVEVLPDAETIEFMWKFVGYCLTASVEEEVFVFCYGAGANGKTKLAEVLK